MNATAAGTGENTRNGSRPPWGKAWPLAIVLLFGATLLALHPYALADPFFSDDYLFLDRAGDAGFGSIWSRAGLAYGYWRPWSRGLHFWVLEHAFGARPLPFHVASIALGTLALGCFFLYALRVAGTRVAFGAAFGVVALAAWDLPVRWPSAAQDLWAMALGLASLLAFAHGRVVLACIALVPALLSKETAGVVPLLALAHAVIIEWRSWRAAVVRVLPLAGVVALWALVHPALGGGLGGAQASPVVHQNPIRALLRSVLAMANLDAVPRPATHPALLFATSTLIAAFAGWLAWLATSPRVDPSRAVPDSRRIATLGMFWALIAWLPLAMPSLIWQPYYVLFGALGFWLAAAALLPRPALVAAIAIAVFFRLPRLQTSVDEWGDATVHARGRQFMARTEVFLRGAHPDPPPHARMFFGAVPRGTVFVLGRDDAPALRVWYGGDVRGNLWQDYRPRAPGEPPGPDYFFLADSTTGWREVLSGPEPLDIASRANPEWGPDHERLAITLTDAGATREAGVEYEKLATAFPQRADYAYLAGLCAETAGDPSRAAQWYQEAALRPGADARMKERARGAQP